MPVVQLPPYTTYAGPWLAPTSEDWPTHRRLRWEQRAIAAMAEQLPRMVFFRQNCWPDFSNGLPLIWQGFRLHTRYTYVLPPALNESSIYARMKHTVRTDLRHAYRTMVVEPCANADRLYAAYSGSLQRIGQSRPFAPFERLVRALYQRRSGVGWVSRCQRSGADVAGLLLAFDARWAAVVVAGRICREGYPGGLHCLYAEAIRFCALRGLWLDLEGSMLPGVERVFRALGAQPRPYLGIQRWATTGLFSRCS